MNSQEKKIVVGGVVIAALSSAGFSMAQGDFNHIDDDYKSPTIISEKTLASNESTSINTPKTDVAIVDEKIEIKDESNEKVKSKVNTLKQTSKPQTNTSTLQNKPQQKPTEPEVVPEVPEEKPTEPEVVPEAPEEKPTEPEVVPEVPEEKPTEPEVAPEVPVTGLVEDSIEKIETPSVEKQFDIN